MVTVDFQKRSFVWVGLVVVLAGLGFVFAYGSGDGTIMGHSWDELVNIPAVFSDGKVSWNELEDIPSGFADGVDDEGSGGDTTIISDGEISWDEITGIPSGFADGDDEGSGEVTGVTSEVVMPANNKYKTYTVTANCPAGQEVVSAVGFTNDYEEACSASTRTQKCSHVSFPDCTGSNSCTYTANTNDCAAATRGCLQIVCA